VHDAGFVRGFDAGGDLETDLDRFVQCQRSARQPLRQCFAFHALEHEVAPPLDFLEAVDGCDIGMRK